MREHQQFPPYLFRNVRVPDRAGKYQDPPDKPRVDDFLQFLIRPQSKVIPPEPVVQNPKRAFQPAKSLKRKEEVVDRHAAYIICWFPPFATAPVKDMIIEVPFKEDVERMEIAMDLA